MTLRFPSGRHGEALLSLIILNILLAACASNAAPSLLPTPTLRSLPSLAPTSLPSDMECLVVSSQPTPDSTAESIFPAPGPSDHILGDPSAQATFLVYTDYQSPAAAALHSSLKILLERYPAALRLIQRPFPLPANDKSILAAVAAEAAGRQERYWEFNAVLFEQQNEWAALDGPGFQEWLALRAESLGLDQAQFVRDLRDPALKTQIDRAQRFGLENGIPIMPFVLVNGSIYQGPRDLRTLDGLVSLLRMESMQFTACPPFIIDPTRQYTARLQTSRGEVVLQLYPAEAPLAVNNFVFLARQGWYDGVAFHRVIAGELAQAGDPSGSGYGSPGYAFRDEIGKMRFDHPGILAMANAGPDSNGSQFFITLNSRPDLDGKYTIFGQVLSGLEVVSSLTPRDPAQAGDLPDPDRILKVEIEEK